MNCVKQAYRVGGYPGNDEDGKGMQSRLDKQ